MCKIYLCCVVTWLNIMISIASPALVEGSLLKIYLLKSHIWHLHYTNSGWQCFIRLVNTLQHLLWYHLLMHNSSRSCHLLILVLHRFFHTDLALLGIISQLLSYINLDNTVNGPLTINLSWSASCKQTVNQLWLLHLKSHTFFTKICVMNYITFTLLLLPIWIIFTKSVGFSLYNVYNTQHMFLPNYFI